LKKNLIVEFIKNRQWRNKSVYFQRGITVRLFAAKINGIKFFWKGLKRKISALFFNVVFAWKMK